MTSPTSLAPTSETWPSSGSFNAPAFGAHDNRVQRAPRRPPGAGRNARVSTPLNVSVVMWPIEDWRAMAGNWRRAEEMGFHTAWVYDHLAWRGHRPWDEAYTILAAAAAVTERIRLGTLVSTPNFRQPLPTAAAIRTVDRISAGRLTLGLGAGGADHTSDGDVLGRTWTPRERADRFEEWVSHLDHLLTSSPVTAVGEHFSAVDVTVADGLVQQRPPFFVAGNGPRGLALAVRFGQGWIANPQTPGAGAYDELRTTLQRLADAGEKATRDVSGMPTLLLTGFTGEPWTESVGAFDELAGRYADLGVTDVAIHWPRPGTEWACDWNVFEAIAERADA